MGREHRAALQDEIRKLGGGGKLRVFIDDDGISPHYRQHLEDTFREEGVKFVDARREANFVFSGQVESTPGIGQVFAFFRGGQLVLEGEL